MFTDDLISSRRIFNNSAFTLLEILIVVILIGIISSFAIPNYQKSLEVAYEREAMSGMIQIIQARKTYLATHNVSEIPFPLDDMTVINNTLKTSLSSDKITYHCVGGWSNGGTSILYSTLECFAESPWGWNLHTGWSDSEWTDEFHCGNAGPCPTCTTAHNGCNAN